MDCLSVISTIIAAFAVAVSVATFLTQRRFNKNSVKPIINIILGNYEDDIYVKLVNNGMGPAIITELECEYCGEIKIEDGKKNSLISLLNQEGTTSSVIDEYSTYVEDIKGRCISPGAEIVLVRLNNSQYNVAIRLMLKDIIIRVYYKDIYGGKFKEKRMLDFYGDNI